MALGDGIRRNLAFVSAEERNRFINAIIKLDTTKFFPDGLSYWDKQEEIHKNAHFAGVNVHSGIGFIPWHRAVVNNFEKLLREVDPALSLHYWDWTTDPRVAPPGGVALFTDELMDNWSGEVSHLLNDFESTEDAETGNGHNKIWRDVGGVGAKPDGTPDIPSDADILSETNFFGFAGALKDAHDFTAHSYIGGTISQAHYSFHDPFVFLLHSNVDRLWAKWQTDPAHPERLELGTAYAGVPGSQIVYLETEKVEPWAGGTGLEPWASDPTKRIDIVYTDISIISPACYDTNQSNFFTLEAENQFNGATDRYRIEFNDVPEAEETWRAAVIRVYSCEDATLRVKSGSEPSAPFSVLFPPLGEVVADHAEHGVNRYIDVRIWFSFTAGAVGTAPQLFGPDNITIECVESGDEFDFELSANTIERPTVAVQLVLDQSGSMSDPAGTSGLTRLQVLQDAATLFANLIPKDNGIGIIRFDDDAYPPDHGTYGGMFITKVASDAFNTPTKNTARTQISLHGAHGNTSVGDGIEMGRTQLDDVPVDDYDEKAMIVFTDGLQNTPQSIEEVADLINNRTFAIGLGTETQVDTLALHNITNSSGGYLLLSGLTTASIDDQYRMMKFFMQILANVTNTQIIKDPTGYINAGNKVKIPFIVSGADITCRVISVTQYPFVKLSVEMPDGQLITTANAGDYNADFESNNQNTVTCDFPLPVLKDATSNHAGKWYAVLEIDEAIYKRYSDKRDVKYKGSSYCVSIHSRSNVKMDARLDQTSMEPGATMTLRAKFTEYSIPLQRSADVTAEVERPDHTKTTLSLSKVEPGIYEASMPANMAGVYHFRVIASGVDFKGSPFTREQILTGSVFRGGNNPGGPRGDGGGPGGSRGDDKCCRTMILILWIIAVLLFLILLLLLIFRR
jgi:hypothetical protein